MYSIREQLLTTCPILASLYMEILHTFSILPQKGLIFPNFVFSQTFTPNLPIFYTDISVISVTFCNSGLGFLLFWDILLYRLSFFLQNWSFSSMSPRVAKGRQRSPRVVKVQGGPQGWVRWVITRSIIFKSFSYMIFKIGPYPHWNYHKFPLKTKTACNLSFLGL